MIVVAYLPGGFGGFSDASGNGVFFLLHVTKDIRSGGSTNIAAPVARHACMAGWEYTRRLSPERGDQRRDMSFFPLFASRARGTEHWSVRRHAFCV